jgi:MOSC domain-containing protein YiiM
LLQVCQPRQPCFKLDLLHKEHLSSRMIRTFQSGWYYSVVRPGALAAGDAVALHARPNPDFPFPRLVEIVYRKRGQPADLVRMTDMEGLAPQWRERARLWLANS